MLDAGRTVTVDATRQFTVTYLASVGATLDERDGRVHVSVPSQADTDLSLDGSTLVFAADPAAVDSNATWVGPESQVFTDILEEARDQLVVGAASMTTQNTEVRLPDWLVESRADVEDAAFIPEGEGAALCALFRVEVETVSEYQTTFLDAVAADLEAGAVLPELAETYLELTDVDRGELDEASLSLQLDDIVSGLDRAREELRDRIDPTVTEIRESASRAAGVELEEYHDLQSQRLTEYRDRLEELDSRLKELDDEIRRASADAITKLESKRERLRVEYEALEEKYDTLAARRSNGFPEKRSEVYDRHSVSVSVEAVTITLVSYEQGRLQLSVREESNREATMYQTVGFSYSAGVGCTDAVNCDRCGRALSSANPALPVAGQLRGERCCTKRVDEP